MGQEFSRSRAPHRILSPRCSRLVLLASVRSPVHEERVELLVGGGRIWTVIGLAQHVHRARFRTLDSRGRSGLPVDLAKRSRRLVPFSPLDERARPRVMSPRQGGEAPRGRGLGILSDSPPRLGRNLRFREESANFSSHRTSPLQTCAGGSSGPRVDTGGVDGWIGHERRPPEPCFTRRNRPGRGSGPPLSAVRIRPREGPQPTAIRARREDAGASRRGLSFAGPSPLSRRIAPSSGASLDAKVASGSFGCGTFEATSSEASAAGRPDSRGLSGSSSGARRGATVELGGRACRAESPSVPRGVEPRWPRSWRTRIDRESIEEAVIAPPSTDSRRPRRGAVREGAPRRRWWGGVATITEHRARQTPDPPRPRFVQEVTTPGVVSAAWIEAGRGRSGPPLHTRDAREPSTSPKLDRPTPRDGGAPRRSRAGPRSAVARRLMHELQREANTLRSKSADPDTSRASIDLKVLIEQMREQVQNIE